MPRKLKRTSGRKPRVYSSNGSSYDTKMIITIILLLFAYPIGLICMWAWMRTWPSWLKIVITLPLLISVFFMMVVFYAVGHVLKDARMQRVLYQRQMMQDNFQYFTSPTISPGMTY
jgi:hypothetical protein